MKVLITGGAGYIGTELTYLLSRRNDIDEILIYDNLSRPNYNLFIIPEKIPLQNVTYISGDILDSRKLKSVLKGIDIVFHLAARVTTPYSDESAHLYEQVNHWGTAEVVSAVEDSNISRFIFLSSASVYGFSEKIVGTRTLLNPKTYYGAAKMRAEEQVRRLEQKLSTYIIRCANVYGYSKSMRFDAVINRFLFSVHLGGRMTVQGSGNQIRAFAHIGSVAECLERMVSSRLSSGTYNIVDRNLSILDITKVVQKIYPQAETLFVSQHVEPRHLKLSIDGSLGELLHIGQRNLVTELKEFSSLFAIKAIAAQ